MNYDTFIMAFDNFVNWAMVFWFFLMVFIVYTTIKYRLSK